MHQVLAEDGSHPQNRSRRRAALISLAIGFGMLGGKWSAYWLTGSHAILSDALESVVHVVATGFAFLSIVLGARPPDDRYPYGYGKINFFSAGFEGGMIALAACAIVYEVVQGLIQGTEPRRLDVGLILIVVASVVNLVLGLWLIREGRRTDSLVLIADGQHVLTDAYTSFGVVVGVGLVLLTGANWLDPACALLVALNILRTGYHLVREGVTGLMDRSNPDLLARIVEALQAGRRPGWIDLHNLRAWQAGDRTFVDFHLVVPEVWTVGRLHDENDRCRDLLRMALGPATEAIIHFDPDHDHDHDHDHDDRDIPPAEETWTVDRAIRSPSRRALDREVTTSGIVPDGG